ncbi:hypothetical protein VRU48_14830 [Pedobacter sp. KR3-3]|uniref:DUF3945 domain-containing protein n=1 Tax=Pedobacter albus TaxID=3113905 RepID=A0ABU7IAA0_9SPHI|nr:hypothetical protein [Pedobacter sp. KR3-3]MEE1946396.1 hypothetical protein [Pedobacter sp. KR3-3]
MNIDNFEQLKEQLYRKGFGDTLNIHLEASMKSGQPEFTLETVLPIEQDEVGYRLHFRNDLENDKVYFNSYDVALLSVTDPEGNPRQHSFQAEKLITAMEAYHMLKHGDLVAVNKNLFNKDGEKYNTWLSLDLNGPKDEYNNYPLNSYHEKYYQKYPFILSAELQKMPVPVKELEHAGFRENIGKSLKKAHLVPVTILLNGSETKGFLAVNPAKGRVDLYDSQMKLVESKQQSAEVKKTATQQQSQQAEEPDVKKKPWPDQKVNWTQKNQAGKGKSI